ncbi:hypothetical protein HYU91_02850 [Candidatus Collierbacteria bacterium]|nr:hypothetical protein [Candidatus Collierbacteria bacterium]
MVEIKISTFEDKKTRRHWDERREKWFFSVIDIVAALTEQPNFNRAKTYWTTLKNRLKNEGSEVVTRCDQLKMLAKDGKMRETDVADVETIFRLIQSVPSKKAEPIKLWRQCYPKVWKKTKIPAKKGGRIAKNARLELEQKTGKGVVSGSNYLPPRRKGLRG